MNAVNVFEDWLENYLNFEKNPKKNIFWIDTIDFLCKRFDNPQDNSPCFHVAGSKGKGSVSRMISSILEEAGYSVGVYSSPHIIDFRERISKPSSFFEEFIYEDTVKELVPKIESIIPEDLPGGRPLTWFELVTIYAFLCFRRAKVDWTVYEVGMGGRLDATNIVRPKLCCITPIELEHTEFLGDTIEKIAGEKAGIIKNCTPVIIAKQQTQSVNEVFIKKAEEKHAPIYFVDKLIDDISYKFDKNSHKMNISIESSIFSRTINANLSLLGGMQAQNAAQAAIAVKKIYPNLNENIIEKGLEKAFLPGRFEIVSNPYCFEGIPNLILDGAHTVKSISLTLDTLKAIYGDNKV
ncbi:MAG: bifunctional folylpolyglutamate synthase/dihydrofolate synthase, partial [Treponema sp.]|nr:bifunctional folylpolyglutamate synthase/dihydrofolate synthase [Treponema sp.]